MPGSSGSRRHRWRRHRSSSGESSDESDSSPAGGQHESRVSSYNSPREKKDGEEHHVSFWWLALASSLIFVPAPFINPSTPDTKDLIFSDFGRDSIDIKLNKMYGSMGNIDNSMAPSNEHQKSTYDYQYPNNPNQFNFRMRPQGLRWRDESVLARMAYNQTVPQNFYNNNNRGQAMAMPLVTERPRSHLGRNMQHMPTTSAASSQQEPSIEDIELIDVLWRSDIAAEKGTRQLGVAEQYERDLQLLTAKSGPLTDDEAAKFEEYSKNYYEDFYSGQFARPTTEKSNHLYGGESTVDYKRQSSTPSDEDLAALFEDVSKEGGQLDRLDRSTAPVPSAPEVFNQPQQPYEVQQQNYNQTPQQSYEQDQPVLHDVSLSQGIVYTQQNITDMRYLQDHQQSMASSQQSQQTDLYNGTAIPMHPWLQQAEMQPQQQMYPVNNSFVNYPAQPEPVPIVSTGSQFDHAYPAAPTSVQSAQQQVSPVPVFEPYYTGRTLSFSNESSSVCSSSSSSATSPHYISEIENHTPPSRYYGKLAPRHEDDEYYESNNGRSTAATTTGNGNSQNPLPRRRGRQSKDEQLAHENSLPVSAKEIAEMSLNDLQKMLKSEQLDDLQKALIRKIRRRGKNKVAARTCRQRRGDRHPMSNEKWNGPKSESSYDDLL